MLDKLNETVSSASISSSPTSLFGADNIMRRIDTNMNKLFDIVDYNKRKPYKNKKAKKINYKKLDESFDLSSALAKIDGLGRAGSPKKRDVVTYGVEDDKGNLMKVTVSKDQSEEFEKTLANSLSDIETLSMTGDKEASKDTSMAELLYNLNQQFDIVDVDFPRIPKDMVYNVRQTSSETEDESFNDNVSDDDSFEDSEDSEDFNSDNDFSEDSEDSEDSDNFDDDMDMDMEDDSDLIDSNTKSPEDLGFGNDGDDDTVSDFEEEPMNDTGSSQNPNNDIVGQLLDYLKKRDEVEIERAKAEQAKYSAMTMRNTIDEESELNRLEAEMEKRKKDDERVKRMSEIAKYKATLGESVVLEGDEYESVQSVNRLKSSVQQKWRVEQGDSPETVKYKNLQRTLGMQELNIRAKQAKAREDYNNWLKTQSKLNSQRNNQPQQNMQNNNQGDGSAI